MKSSKLPETLAEGYVKASYVPLDGLPIFSSHDGRSCGGKSEQSDNKEWKGLLDALPDQTIRMTVGQYTNSGTLSFGPISAGMKGTQYKIVLDYINNDAINVPLLITRTQDTNKNKTLSVFREVKPDTNFIVSRIDGNDAPQKTFNNNGSNVVNVTVYVGIGLRITAHITANKAGVDLSSLSALSAGAETGAITGTLTVQTIGITGPSVSASLPMPSDLTEESIQSSILALGGIKSSIYDTKNTTTTARVVGMYIPVGGNQILVENIRNALAKKPIEWKRPCIQTKRTETLTQ